MTGRPGEESGPAPAGRPSTSSAAEFEEQRPRLLGLAYRLLGSADEAEDVVQDAFLRWSGADREMIVSPSGWLAKVVANLSLNRLTSARARRERYVGPWLPEPALTDGGALGPLESAEQRDSVSLAVLTLLERLTPAERGVLVLREAFAYSHRDIAGVLGLSEANSRVLYRRGRQRLSDARPRFRPALEQRRALLERFLAAAREGDLPKLEALLSEDVTSWADGGGRVGAARHPILGRDRVARYLAGTLRKFTSGLELVVTEVNGEPAVLARPTGGSTDVVGVLAPQFGAGGRIGSLRLVVNPQKLGFVTRQTAKREAHAEGGAEGEDRPECHIRGPLPVPEG